METPVFFPAAADLLGGRFAGVAIAPEIVDREFVDPEVVGGEVVDAGVVAVEAFAEASSAGAALLTEAAESDSVGADCAIASGKKTSQSGNKIPANTATAMRRTETLPSA